MSVYRIQKNKDNPYVMINKEMAQDKTLSWKARGLLLYLLSLPDDWNIYESELIKHATDGRDSTKAGIKELIEKGYIIRSERRRDEKGRLKEYNYDVYEVSTKNGKSNVGETKVGKPVTTNNKKLRSVIKMIFKTVEQITNKFIKDGWNKDTSFEELTLNEAIEKGLSFAIEGIKKGRKYFKMNVSNNIYDDKGKIVWYNIRMCK